MAVWPSGLRRSSAKLVPSGARVRISELSGLGKNSVTVDDNETNDGIKAGGRTMQAHTKKTPRTLKLAQVRQVKTLKSIPLA
ncbi:hypothetical protein N7455_012197 [Penicillium solitum]|uniref:uncharacterized protein n=1 Tax=Penicillium solitum TaxID=60172 RepID=UPI0017B307D0|nr:hypothetical protein HAV15_002863 [Penicillium sp. str. \